VCKLYGWGWQPTLFVFGMAGVALAAVFLLFFRNQPRQHPLVNAAEAQLIEEGSDAPGQLERPTPASALWHGILTSRSLWVCSLVQVGTNFGWAFLGTKLPEYLERVHQVPKIEQGWLVFLPFVLSVPMTMIGGAWTDWLTRRWGPYLGRAFPMGSTRFMAAAAFLACTILNAPWPITVAMCVMSVTSDMGLPALWAYNLDVGGRNVGLILGWGNMWGNLGAFASPVVLGLIQERFGWDAVFVTCAVVFVGIGLAAFGVDATRPIVATDPAEKQLA
jgi:ACS family glucarate transporter-like MFS transporter